jgi:hypothetical protein
MVTVKLQLLDELNLFLDEQIEQAEQTLLQLDKLRAAVVRRDKGALEELMQQVQLQGQRKKRTEIKQQHLQHKLSAFCQCDSNEVTVSRLCNHLDGKDRQVVQCKQSKLRKLTSMVQNECKAAELMLRECARFNRLLLSAMIGNQNQTRTYTSQGKEQWNIHCDLMNTKM